MLALGIALRLWSMARSGWLMDGDEATFGIMAQHILHGERPIFLYGQPYMGALQAYLGAALFAAFGVSRIAFRAVTVPEFMAFGVSIYFLARRVAGNRVALLATLLAAFPPVYVAASTARLWGPLLDAMTLGNLILLLAIDEAYGETPSRRPWLRYLLMGLCGGVGFWLHGQIIVYLATAAILLLLHDRWILVRPRLLAAVAGFAAGAAPVLEFARTHSYNTFDQVLGIGAQPVSHNYRAIALFYLRENLPRVLGVSTPWGAGPWWLKLPVALIVGTAILSFTIRRRRGVLGWLTLSLRQGEPVDALILFGGVMSVAFVFSSFGALALQFPNFDATGRYAIPLASVVPIILAAELERLQHRSELAAVVVTTALLGVTLIGYVRPDPMQVWQSPYWNRLPPSDTQLIAALDQLGVDAVWINHWAGTPLMFDTHERIAASDYYDLVIGHGIDRLSSDSLRVRFAAFPAYVFVTGQPNVPIETWFRNHRIAYDKRVVPDYVIIRPRQHVYPSQVLQFLSYDQ